MGGADARVSNQHPLSANHRAAVARPHARLQALAPRRHRLLSLLPLRSRTQVRVGPHRVSGLVVAGVRDQDRFHAPICRPLEPWISFHYSDQTLLRFISRPRRSRVIKLIFFPLEILILFGWEKKWSFIA